MFMETSNQPEVFVAMIYIGFIGGIFFDLCQSIRYVLKARLIKEFIDIIFWGGFSALIIIELLNKNFGRIQFYCIIGIALGVLIYEITVSKIVFQLFYGIAATVRRIIVWALQPIVWLRKKFRFYRACPDIFTSHLKEGFSTVTSKFKKD